MGTQPKHLDPLGLLRRGVRFQDLHTVEDNDMYRGTGGAGVSLNLGATVAVGYTILMGTAGAGAATIPVFGDQSLLFTCDNFEKLGAGSVTMVLTITGYDKDGVLIVEDLTLLSVAQAVKSFTTANVFSYVTSIVVKSITLNSGGTLDDTAVTGCLLAIGHGVSTIATQLGLTRFPISSKVLAVSEILALIDPNGAPVTLSLDAARHTLLNASGTTFVAGRYRVIYNPPYNGKH